MLDLKKYPEGFITQEELDMLAKIELKNSFILIKPIPVTSKTKIKIVTTNENGKVQDKKATKGVVLKVAEDVKDIKIGDEVGWSSNAVFYRVVEIENEMYLGLTPNEIFYKC